MAAQAAPCDHGKVDKLGDGEFGALQQRRKYELQVWCDHNNHWNRYDSKIMVRQVRNTIRRFDFYHYSASG